MIGVPEGVASKRERFEIAIWIPGGIGIGTALIGLFHQDVWTILTGASLVVAAMFAQDRFERQEAEKNV